MKNLLVVSAIAALGLSSAAFAGGLPEEMPAAPSASSSDTGVYVGINGGWGFTNWRNVQSVYGHVTKDNGVVGRAFFGYNINRYFALEAGYSYFANKVKITGYPNEIKTNAFDLYGKGSLPLVDSVDLYAKLGAGYLMSNNAPIASNTTQQNNKGINVAFGAGIDYSITPNVIANAEWSRINGYPTVALNNNYQPNTDAFLIGVRYKFDL